MINNTPVLKGNRIHLEILQENHYDALYEVAQNKNIWEYTGTNGFGTQFEKWFEFALINLNSNEHLPFVVRNKADQKILGSTRLYDIQEKHLRTSLGFTWYIPEVWGTHVNPECKLLMLQHAFEGLNFNRVQIDTDVRNKRSRAAILKLGAKEEGLLRQNMILDNGYVRDSYVFSIIKSEWLEVKEKLLRRLELNLNKL